MIRKSILGSFMLAASVQNGAMAEQVPNIFAPDTPAIAAEVNENFAFITDRLALLEDATNGEPLLQVEKSIDVDCSNDPAALNLAYNENWQYQELNFNIIGNCYGDIAVDRSSVDESGNWDNTSFQPKGQNINIRPQEGQDAGLIPNDLSGSVTVFGGFGGGLYLNDLTITLSSTQYDDGVFFSRNAQGSVNNVTIIGPESISGNAILLQEGAQAYINGVSASNTNYGVLALNGAVLRFLGEESTFTDVNRGIRLISSLSRHNTSISISASVTSLELFSSANVNAFGQDINITSGNIVFTVNSALQVQNLLAENVGLFASASMLQIDGILTLDEANLDNSRLTAQGGSLANLYVNNVGGVGFSGTEETPFSLNRAVFERNSNAVFNRVTSFSIDVFWNSSLNAENSNIDNLHAESSSVRGFNAEVREVLATNEAFVEFYSSSLTEALRVESSTATLGDSTFSGNIVARDKSHINVTNTSFLGAEITRGSGIVINDGTIENTESVVDFLDASLWISRGSRAAIFGNTTLIEGARPINVEALSFLELDFGVEQALNGVTIECGGNSVAYIPESADVSVTGC